MGGKEARAPALVRSYRETKCIRLVGGYVRIAGVGQQCSGECVDARVVIELGEWLE